jgi:methyl-accepting chemotaxis protein
MKSIQTKLTVTILIIFLMALGALGSLNYWKARSIITESVTDDMSKLAINSAGDVGAWLETRKLELTMIAAAPMVQNGNLDDIFPFLVNAVKMNSIYISLGYTLPTGDCISSTGARTNLADREWFQRAMRGETFVSDPFLSATNGHLTPVVAVPVKKNGKVVGVISGAADMEGLTGKVLTIKAGQTGYAFVVQGDGLRIVHPDKNIAMKSNPLKDAGTEPAMKQLTEQMVRGEKGLASLKSSDGIEKYYAYAPIPGMNWSLAISVPVSEVTGGVSALTTISLITIVVVLVIAALAITVLTSKIVGPLRNMVAYIEEVAAGDLSERQWTFYSRDEIGQLAAAIIRMRGNLRSLITQISQATEQVSASSEELTASAEQSVQAANQITTSITNVATGSTTQMGAANEATSVVEEMSASIQQVAANANQVATQSAQAAGKAKDGSGAVDKAVSQMIKIENTVNTSAQVVAELGERSKEIGQIVGTISGIAGQTNLLALNAAIEAARAGEQGRGFAVVAEEVRKLAEQSQEAAKQIAELIGEIQGETDKAVLAMNNGTREVKAGADVVNAAGDAFREIVKLVTQVSGQVQEISTAIHQMATGSQQIVGMVRKIDGLSQKSAAEAQGVSAATEEQLATLEEIASSSQALSMLAEDMQAAVRQFMV